MLDTLWDYEWRDGKRTVGYVLIFALVDGTDEVVSSWGFRLHI
jgi:hypothetical protein